MNRERTTIARLAMLACLALAIGCGATTSTTETGGSPGTTAASAGGAGSTSPGGAVTIPQPGTTSKSGTTPTTCVSVPASTGVGTKGGGELICSGPDDGTISSPPNTDTTIPDLDTTVPQPDANHGVAVVNTGGGTCPASAQVCNAMYAIVPADLTLTRTDAPAAPAVTATTSSTTGTIGISLAPGAWHITATPTTGNRTCSPQDVTITAGTTVNVSIDCVLPG